jgi:high frequency lysogenization protein
MLLPTKYDNITIALAGLAQAISLVREVAQTGKPNEVAYHATINSIFATNPDDTIQIFGDINQLQCGLEALQNILQPTTDTAQLMTRHMLALMRVQKKISNSPQLLDTLTQRLTQAKKQVAYFSLTHPTVLANLADIYISIITPLRFRFFVRGNQQILNVRENMEKIRALLLAGIRASVLWRQLGGSRLQLLFTREKIKTSALNLLKQIQPKENH